MSDTPELVEVRLLSVPIPLRERSTEHGEELLREMTLISQQLTAGDGPDLPVRLIQLVGDVRATFGVFTEGADAELDAAAEKGLLVVDEIVYRVPVSTGAYCTHLLDIIDETDRFCRAGEHLLTLASPPDVRAYQDWILGEFVRQTAGLPPIPWPAFQPAAG